jgi:hypothetical protein
MRVLVSAFLAGGLLCMPALADENPPAAGQTATDKTPGPTPAKPDAAKPEGMKPAAVPANKPVDYGDMRCAFAIRHRDSLDSQIIAWAGGFLEGYAKGNPGHVNAARLDELTDPAILRTHIRGYCLKHKDKSLEAALLAMAPHGGAHPTETPPPAAHPAAPAPQPKPAPANP